MLTIFLVDDEVLVRTNIKLMLAKYLDLFSVCGEADCGEEALKKLPKDNPDIILSDMVMPGMDGVEFCKEAKKMLPGTHFIALSNYDDYRLVHDTLINGGDDYILKHSLSPELLKQTLSRYKPATHNTRSSYRSDELITFQEKFVLDLITRLLNNEHDISYQINAFGIRLSLHNVCMVMVRIDNYLSVIRDPGLERRRIVHFSICNIANEILSHYESGLLTHLEDSYFGLLLSFSDVNSKQEIRQHIDAIIHQLSSNLHTYLNITASFLIGKICPKITDIPDQYNSLYHIMKNSCFSEAGTILYADETELTLPKNVSDNNVQLAIETLRQEVTNSFADEAQCTRAVGVLFHVIRKSCHTYRSASSILLDLLNVCNEICKQYQLSLSDLLEQDITPTEQLAAFSSLDEAQLWFTHLFIKVNHVMYSPSDEISSYTKKCLVYIHAHYSEPITLSSTADFCGISSSYLSQVFKKDMGQGFSTYLNEYRIQIAAKAVREGQKDLREIAIGCGFQDYAYFFRVFKKITSLTPTEYRETPPSHVRPNI